MRSPGGHHGCLTVYIFSSSGVRRQSRSSYHRFPLADRVLISHLTADATRCLQPPFIGGILTLKSSGLRVSSSFNLDLFCVTMIVEKEFVFTG